MNEFTLLPDDPKLTAYALGELEGEERAAVETWLRMHPEAREAVEEIRAAAAKLEAALASEPMESSKPVPHRGPYAPVRKSILLRFPQVYYVIGGLAAACFALVLALHESPPHGSIQLYEVSLTPAATPPPTATQPATVNLPASAPELVGNEGDAASNSTTARGDFGAVGVGLLEQTKKPVNLGGALVASAAPSFSSKSGIPAPFAKIDGGYGGARGIAQLPTRQELLSQRWSSTSAPGAAARPTALKDKAEYHYAELRAAQASQPAAAAIPEIGAMRFDKSSRRIGQAHIYGAASSWAGGEFQKLRTTLGSPAQPHFDTESYDFRRESDFVAALENPLSTFSIDVDTASYSNVRRMIERGIRPPIDAVRIEEMLNYFPYQYAAPRVEKPADAIANNLGTRAEPAPVPFAASMEVAEAPWAPAHRLVRIGLKGREVPTSERGAANLVFLLDVSGSMNEPNKLPLVKESLRLLVGHLRPEDHVAIVTYAGASGLALPSTPVSKAREITEAIDDLTPAGSTNGAMGIQLAYDIAKANFITGGINRVILCTDGDFNVGVTSAGDLVRLITEKARSGVFLTALGFGMGNYKDATLQQIADAGNGNYGYIDKRREAEKLLVEQVSGTLVTIAKDVKIQVEFNPAKVASYRLIGYEKRLLKKEDFNNDTVDAGEIGAGHTVTALYEIVPVGAEQERGLAANGAPAVDELKYRRNGMSNAELRTLNSELGTPNSDPRTLNSEPGNSELLSQNSGANSSELLTLKIRYKEPAGDVSKKLEFPLIDEGRSFAQASEDFKFASAVAAFGMVLRESAYKGTATLNDVAQWAEAGGSHDPGGYRSEFISLVRQAKTIM